MLDCMKTVVGTCWWNGSDAPCRPEACAQPGGDSNRIEAPDRMGSGHFTGEARLDGVRYTVATKAWKPELPGFAALVEAMKLCQYHCRAGLGKRQEHGSEDSIWPTRRRLPL